MTATEGNVFRRAFDRVARSLMRAGFPLLKLWWRWTHPTLEGVYVAVRCDERVLMIRNSYRNVDSLPSGRRGRGEDPATAAARELREEVGIDVPPETLRPVAEVLLRTRLVDDHVFFFELELAGPPDVTIDRREVVWAAFETLEDARARRVVPIVRRYLDGTLDEIRVGE